MRRQQDWLIFLLFSAGFTRLQSDLLARRREATGKGIPHSGRKGVFESGACELYDMAGCVDYQVFLEIRRVDVCCLMAAMQRRHKRCDRQNTRWGSWTCRHGFRPNSERIISTKEAWFAVRLSNTSYIGSWCHDSMDRYVGRWCQVEGLNPFCIVQLVELILRYLPFDRCLPRGLVANHPLFDYQSFLVCC